MYIMANYFALHDIGFMFFLAALGGLCIGIGFVLYMLGADDDTSSFFICCGGGVIIIILCFCFVFLIPDNAQHDDRNWELEKINMMDLTVDDDVPIGSKLTYTDRVYENGEYYLILSGETFEGYRLDHNIKLKIPEEIKSMEFKDIEFVTTQDKPSLYTYEKFLEMKKDN